MGRAFSGAAGQEARRGVRPCPPPRLPAELSRTVSGAGGRALAASSGQVDGDGVCVWWKGGGWDELLRVVVSARRWLDGVERRG